MSAVPFGTAMPDACDFHKHMYASRARAAPCATLSTANTSVDDYRGSQRALRT